MARAPPSFGIIGYGSLLRSESFQRFQIGAITFYISRRWYVHQRWRRFVEVSIPGKSGFLDLGKPSAGSGNTSDGDGCLSGDLSATVVNGGTSNTCTFNGVTADGTVSTSGEYVVIRISASKDWTGYLDRLSVGWS